MSSIEARIKQGASLTLSFGFLKPDLTPLDLTPYTLRSQIVDLSGNLVANLPVSVDQATAGTAHAIVASTASWPIGTLRGDVLLVSGSYTAASETFGVIVERPVTR